MSIRTELFLAWKYFKPKRSAVSIITLISVIGVALGVAVLIVVLAVMTGFTDKMREKLLDTTSHAQIRSKFNGYVINDPEPLIELVRKQGGDAVPVIISPVLMQNGDSFVPKVVIGLDPKAGKTDRLKMHEVVKIGSPELNRGSLIVSYIIARDLRLGLEQKVLLHSPSNLAKLVKRGKNGKLEVAKNLEMYLPSEYRITGISSFNKYDFDRDFLFMHIDDAAELLDLDMGVASAIYIWVPDPFDMEPFMRRMREELSRTAPNTFIQSWQEINGRLLGVLQVEKNMQFFLLVFIVLVAAFSITNTLITTVIQKTKEIGLLKAMGASSGMIMRIFILQGFFVGLIGTLAGIALGSLVVEYRMAILNALRTITGQEIFPAEIYYFNELPARIVMTDLGWIALISIVLCTFGGVIPAFRAAKLDPSRALRYE
ncbi:MAG: ABC transporter permease [Lentisphaeria bacterium]|nr:ABC transporter permease [Lentisphaeria bacterium]